MRIARLRISGFRGIKEADIVLNKTSVLIGPNNVGKTTIIEALALVLGRDGMVRNLTEHDFYGSRPIPASRIKIIATIVDFPSPDPGRLPDWFGIRRGVPKWYDPVTNTESTTPKTAPHLLACEIAFQARFDHENLEVETCRYFYDDASIDNVFLDDMFTPVGIGLLRDIGFFLIPANRSWDRMMSFGSELFRRVINSASGLPAESILAERDRLRAPSNPLEDDTNLSPIIQEVNKEITALFGKSSDLKLRITTTDSAGVLESVVPHFENPDGTLVPSKRQGSGLISLQSLFLLLHFGKQRIDQGKGFCFALEEPEIHLPPAIQRRVLKRLKTLSSQVIVSTHSSLIAGFSEPTELLVINNIAGIIIVNPLLKNALGASTPNSIRTLIQVRRVEVVTALMTEIAIVPEGLIDYEWLSLLVRLLELQNANPLISATIGIVPTHDAAVCITTKLIKEAHPNTIALVDGDSAGDSYVGILETDATQKILRWPNNWVIENVIGWILEPAEATALAYLNSDHGIRLTNIAELVTCLKSDSRTDPNHLKGDRIAYENLTRIISESDEAIKRVISLFEGIIKVAKGDSTPKFIQTPSAQIFTFTL
jgi:putative ATP-dependent endonuclease of OLD family